MDSQMFDTAVDAGDDDVAGRRRAGRSGLFLAARLTVDPLPAEQVRVRNVSAGGLMAEYPSPIEPGTPVQVELRGIGRIGGRIAWATDGRIGIAFERTIDPQRVARSA